VHKSSQQEAMAIGRTGVRVKNPNAPIRNKEKYNKNKVRNDARKAAARAIVEAEILRKKAATSGMGALFDGMTIDEFLATGESGGDAMQIESAGQKAKVDEELKTDKNGKESKLEDHSFYEFLKQQDRDLMEFDRDDLDEDENECMDAAVEDGVTVDVLSRWETLLVEQKSLPTLKKVLIALRTAGTTSKDIRYTKYPVKTGAGSSIQTANFSIEEVDFTRIPADS
jgi:hypothetical protein